LIGGCTESVESQRIDCTQASEQEVAARDRGKLRMDSGVPEVRAALSKLEIELELKAVRAPRHRPTLAMPAFDGMLYSFDYGEWGGALAYRDPDGRTKVIAEGNFFDVIGTPSGYLAFHQLNHGIPGNGKVYRITREGGQVRADLAQALPGAIQTLEPLKAGGWLATLKDYSGSLVPEPRAFLISKDGVARPATCR
jgi:hypothetical protein